MTRKHFAAIAAAMKNCKPYDNASHEYAQWVRSVDSLAEMCSKANTNFRYTTFIEACGI